MAEVPGEWKGREEELLTRSCGGCREAGEGGSQRGEEVKKARRQEASKTRKARGKKKRQERQERQEGKMYQVGDLEIESPVHIEKRFGRGLVEQPAERHHRAGRAGAATLPRGAAYHTQSDLHSLSCLVQHTHTTQSVVKKK